MLIAFKVNSGVDDGRPIGWSPPQRVNHTQHVFKQERGLACSQVDNETYTNAFSNKLAEAVSGPTARVQHAVHHRIVLWSVWS